MKQAVQVLWNIQAARSTHGTIYKVVLKKYN